MRCCVRVLMVGVVLVLRVPAHANLPIDWPLNQAVIADDSERLVSLLASTERTQEELDYALIAAAGKGRTNAARILTAAGADPNFRIPGPGHTSVITATREDHPLVLRVLLEEGGDPNIQDALGWRPLHHAVSPTEQHLDVIRVLLAHGADVDGRDSLRRTALHRAAGFGHTEAVQLLLRNGADPSLREKYGRTPGERAALGGHHSLEALLNQSRMRTEVHPRDTSSPRITPTLSDYLVPGGIIAIAVTLVFTLKLRFKGAHILGISLAIAANLAVSMYEGRPLLATGLPERLGQAAAITVTGVVLGSLFYFPAALWRKTIGYRRALRHDSANEPDASDRRR